MRRGFTLLEFVMICALFFTLLLALVAALRPPRSIAYANNAQRWNNVNSILNGVHQYSLAHKGRLPDKIGEAPKEICRMEKNCAGLVDLKVLVDEKFMLLIPSDPAMRSTEGTGYLIRRDARGRVFVTAPQAELEEIISVNH